MKPCATKIKVKNCNLCARDAEDCITLLICFLKRMKQL